MRFDQRLVLNRWMLSLFQVDSFEALARHLKDPALETLDENNVSRFYTELTLHLFNLPELPKDVLLTYDQHIVAHTAAINARRVQPIRWKYFQYLTLLFTEIYLDRYFRDRERLMADLNAFVVRFNAGEFTTGSHTLMHEPLASKDQVALYTLNDLRKLAFWNATGSGKTLLMHVNILQFRHYLAAHGRQHEVNRTILLTPNEGLSRQHLAEFAISGFNAEIFVKDSGRLYQGHHIEIIDINKLREESGDKTVAVDSFEGNNLVMVDEGHRGSSGEEWKDKRDKLCATGFSFEYSATFGQAMKAANKPALTQEYAKCILFDYSYKYFYKDGYGKDYSILNLAEDSDKTVRDKYLTACLLAFYQQLRLYEEQLSTLRPYLLARPLWVFVGGSVTKSISNDDITDVQNILLFLSRFVKNRAESISILNLLVSGRPGLLNNRGNEIFDKTFDDLKIAGVNGDDLFAKILTRLFNAPAGGDFYVVNLKGVDGEIELRVGDHKPFGVINVGDDSKLCKKLDTENSDTLVVTERDFANSLFACLNDDESRINLLIGSRKFSEGWSSWRVSTMGLMNIGKKEGSQIIQLFGRGVRLKGYEFSLKRSSMLNERIRPPSFIRTLETLNIFGVRANYMRQFKEYLEEEGMPSDEERIQISLPIVPMANLRGKKLKIIRLRDGADFKRKGPKPMLDLPPDHLKRYPLLLDWYPKIQSMTSNIRTAQGGLAVREEGVLTAQHLAFMDMDAIYFDLQRFKNERAWFNLSISREKLVDLLALPNWYKLLIPPDELQFRSYSQVRRWQEIAVALLKKYCDRYYKHRKAEWEQSYLEYRELDADDPNFFAEYTLLVEESREEIIKQIEELKAIIEAGTLREFQAFNLQAIQVAGHLYCPLLHLSKGAIEVSPVALNDGERDFVRDLSDYHVGHPKCFNGRELYLLRNMSKGRGIGFFEAGNFYPDFIVWLVDQNTQRIAFVDPKGIRNLEGPNDPKIRFCETIKEIQKDLKDPHVILSSFIIANTPYQQVGWWNSGMLKSELENHHVLFQHDDKKTYIKKLLVRILK